MAETQKEKMMRILQITAEEAEALIAADKDIDRGKKMDFDLTPEQEKETRKYRQADRKQTAYKFTQRERKPNELKREIIDEIFGFLCENWLEIAKSGDISNPERQIDFTLKGEKFSLTLTQHRKPKE